MDLEDLEPQPQQASSDRNRLQPVAHRFRGIIVEGEAGEFFDHQELCIEVLFFLVHRARAYSLCARAAAGVNPNPGKP